MSDNLTEKLKFLSSIPAEICKTGIDSDEYSRIRAEKDMLVDYLISGSDFDIDDFRISSLTPDEIACFTHLNNKMQYGDILDPKNLNRARIKADVENDEKLGKAIDHELRWWSRQ